MKLKHLFCLLAVLALTFCFACASANGTTYQSLDIGENTVNIVSYYTPVQFTAKEAGTYVFQSVGDYSTHVDLYDEDGNYLLSEYGNLDGCNFLICQKLSAGSTVMLQVGYDEGNLNELIVDVASLASVQGGTAAVGSQSVSLTGTSEVCMSFDAGETGGIFDFKITQDNWNYTLGIQLFGSDGALIAEDEWGELNRCALGPNEQATLKFP